MLVFTIHAGAGVIDVLPWGAAQPGFHNGLLFLLQLRVGAREPRRNLAARDHHAHIGQQIRNPGLRNIAQMRKQQAQALQIGAEFAAVARGQRRQVGLARGGRVILLLAKPHIIRADAQFLHHHFLVAFELRVRWKRRPVQLQHFLPVDPNAVQLAAFGVRFGFRRLRPLLFR